MMRALSPLLGLPLLLAACHQAPETPACADPYAPGCDYASPVVPDSASASFAPVPSADVPRIHTDHAPAPSAGVTVVKAGGVPLPSVDASKLASCSGPPGSATVSSTAPVAGSAAAEAMT